MSHFKRVLNSLSKVFPNNIKVRINKLLIYGGVNFNVKDYLGLTLLISLILSSSVLFFDYFFRSVNVYSILICISVFFGTQGVFFIYPYFKSEQRVNTVEKNLPDFLNLMAANIRSGMAPLSAMLGSAKNDFGILSDEIKDSISLSMGSKSYQEIFSLLTKRINSKVLRRLVELLATGLKTGGNLSILLEGASEEITQLSVLKKSLITSVRSQMIFIALVIIAGLPFLLTVSTQFVVTIQSLQSIAGPSDLSPSVQQTTISVDFLRTISYIILIITSLFSSLLVGSVIDNSFIQGLKYFIPFLFLSIIIYIIALNVVPSVIGNINLT